MSKSPQFNNVVLIDGVCNLCIKSVRILHKLEPNMLLKFASQQSEMGEQLLKENGIEVNDLDTIFYLEDGKLYERSEAFIALSKHLKEPYRILGKISKVVPYFLRNAIYNLIAKNRYRIFGKQDVCYLPEGDLTERFL